MLTQFIPNTETFTCRCITLRVNLIVELLGDICMTPQLSIIYQSTRKTRQKNKSSDPAILQDSYIALVLECKNSKQLVSSQGSGRLFDDFNYLL